VKVDFFDDELPFFVLLAVLISPCVCPANHGFASFTKDITNAVKTSNETSILGWANADINTIVEEICSPW